MNKFELDPEWVALMTEAKKIGITKEEIKEWLNLGIIMKIRKDEE